MATAQNGDRATASEYGAEVERAVGGGRLVAVDFGSVGVGRRLDELLAALPGQAARTRVVDPLLHAWRSDGDTLAAHADTAARRLLGAGLGPDPLVMGQCTAALFTLELAAALARAGERASHIVLVDPVLPVPADVAEHVAALVGRLGGDAREAAAVTAGLRLDGRLPQLADYVGARLRTVARRRFDGLDLDEDEAEFAAGQLADRYADWTGFLAAQLSRRHTDPGDHVHVLGDAGETQLGPLRDAVAPVPVTVWSDDVPARLAQIFAEG